MLKYQMNNTETDFINNFWDEKITPALIDYIKIPNKSPSFDSNWEKNGYMNQALKLAVEWSKKNMPQNGKISAKKIEGRTPIILIDIPGEKPGNILMYGHLDKQPEMEGWDAGLGPWNPVLKNEKLYGRGGADDGYAIFASLCALKELKRNDCQLPRILILIEFSEESGSPDLPFYIESYSDIIGEPDLVVCLDSGAGDYERLWTTTSLRGLIGLSLRIDVLKEGIHSGGASGHVPSSFRVARQLLSRIENEKTGEILIESLNPDIPEYRKNEAVSLVNILGDQVVEEFPWKNGMLPSTEDNLEGVLRRTWRPALSITGAGGLPSIKNAGNVLRPYTELQLSLRIPPTVDHSSAQNEIERILTKDVPYNADVSIEFDEPASGWNAPETDPWLLKAMDSASRKFYGKQYCSIGEGGTIPFMAMLGEQFPKAQFMITGVLGPGSNAHGPNEFLHIPFAKRLTACIASIISNFPS